MERTQQTDLAHRLARRFDELRDRLAAAVAADEVRGELAGLRRTVNDLDTRTARLATTVGQRLDTLTEALGAATDELGERIDRQGRSRLRRLVWLVVGAGAGVAAAALLDPAGGARRRRQLREQARVRAGDLATEVRSRARHAAEAARDAALEPTDTSQSPVDPERLRQRIRRDALGRFDGTDEVVVTVQPEGRVTLKGPVASGDTERRLVEATRAVAGVAEVVSELEVRLP